jgi:isopenicillin-N epimerase
MSLVAPPQPIPHAWSMFGLDPDMTHLNHGSVGAVPLRVRQARRVITDELESDPRGFFKRRVEVTEAARVQCAEFLAASPDTSAFVRNVTIGVAHVLHAMELSAGDEIVTTDHGYGAVDFNVAGYVRSHGVVHRVARVPLTPTDDEVVDAVLATVTARTRLVICDHITSMTARLLPVARLAARLREQGVALLVDAAHIPGHLPAEVAAIGADFWVGNLHKWAFAPRGTAMLSVSPQWAPRMRPFVESWQYADGYPVSMEFNGTDDFTGWLAAPAGIAMLRELGVERVRAHNAALAHYGQQVVAKALGVAVDDPEPSPLAMRLIPLPAGLGATLADSGRIESAIREQLSTELAVNSRHGVGLLRIAAQIYNTPADFERLAERLPDLLTSLR